MKKLFVFLWVALAGCSVVPESAFETIPGSSMKTITITSNVVDAGDPEQEPMPPSETLIGTVTTNGNKQTIEWSGSLDPFVYDSRVVETEIEFYNEKFVSHVVTTLEDGRTQTDEITYDDNLRLKQVIVTAGDSISTFDFEYSEVVVERIEKKASRNAITKSGFFQRNSFNNEPYYYSVYPFDGSNHPTNFTTGCNTPVSEPERSLSLYNLGVNAISTQTIVPDEGEYIYKSALVHTSNEVFPLSGKVLLTNIAYVDLGYECDTRAAVLNPYMFFEGVEQHLYLRMLFSSSEIAAVSADPSLVSNIHNLRVRISYHYSEQP
jgi:hypothetical protein